MKILTAKICWFLICKENRNFLGKTESGCKKTDSFFTALIFVEMYGATDPLKGYNRRPGGWGYGELRKRENFGEKIKNLRKTKKVNQQELADYLGIKRATISNWEINRRTPSMDDLKRVAEFFGVSLDYFGSDVKDSNMDILSRVMEYFKNEEIDNADKVTLFNNILTAYAHIVLNQDS